MQSSMHRSTTVSGALLALLKAEFPELAAQLPDAASTLPAAPYPPLEAVTKPAVTTAELAYYSNQAQQTWRAHACKETYPEYLRPIRIGGRLNWPTAGVKRLMGVSI